MKLWDKGTDPDKEIERFTVGQDRDLDLHLAKWDVIGSIAHISMLASINLLDQDECDRLVVELRKILHEEIETSKFKIEQDVEDVHSQIELQLTRSLGDAGKKIHSGRSRNDQVLVDLRLYFRSQIKELVDLMTDLFNELLAKAEKHKGDFMPGYTHMQVAMPSSFGLWFSAYAESLAEDLYVLHSAWKISNQNPLGSAAGYGSSFPLDREMTTELLGFDTMSYNSINAQMGRGKTEKVLSFGMASVASTLNKLASDICLYNGQNFQFFKLPAELTTGSSIMPHKSNPDVFEILRAKTNRIQGLPGTISLLLSNLQSGYHRDLQLTKEELVPRIEELKECLNMAMYAIHRIDINTELLHNSLYDPMFTVEEVNKAVLSGVPFRDAYRQVGEKVRDGSYKANKEVSHSHEGSIGNLSLTKIREKMDLATNEFDFEKVENAIKALSF